MFKSHTYGRLDLELRPSPASDPEGVRRRRPVARAGDEVRDGVDGGALGGRQRDRVFGHGAEHGLDGGRVLIDSYHCSRYNLNTRRLTEAMFAQVFARVRQLVDAGGLPAGAAPP